MVFDYIKANTEPDGTIYLLGGEAVVSKNFENLLTGYNVVRLGGDDRYETNIKILNAANAIDGTHKNEVLVCSGAGFADALSTSPVGKPILLVGNTITAGQKQYLTEVGADTAWLVGGTGAVSDEIAAELKEFIPESKTKRFNGEDRFETSYMVAKEFFSGNCETAVLAYGIDFPDGLSGGAVASVIGAPVLLAMNRDDRNAIVAQWVAESGAKISITLGGPTLISDDSIRNIMSQPGAVIVEFK